MRKLFAILIVFFFFYSTSLAQDKLLVAEGTSPNLYITHTVTPKENYYSVGRMYNVSPKELAPYNDLTFEKGFLLGQTIKIPLGPNNFSQGDAPKENEVLVPVYHIMKAKEGLYRVSINYNKVPLDALKKWNNLSGDAVSTGTKLIVGYLKVLKDQSPLASQAMHINPSDLATKANDKKQPAKNQDKEKKGGYSASLKYNPADELSSPPVAHHNVTGHCDADQTWGARPNTSALKSSSRLHAAKIRARRKAIQGYRSREPRNQHSGAENVARRWRPGSRCGMARQRRRRWRSRRR